MVTFVMVTLENALEVAQLVGMETRVIQVEHKDMNKSHSFILAVSQIIHKNLIELISPYNTLLDAAGKDTDKHLIRSSEVKASFYMGVYTFLI